MLRTISLYFHTIRYLKCSQVFFQLWYPIKNLLINSWYPYSKYVNTNLLTFSNINIYSETGNYNSRSRTFTFLNKTHTFSDSIDWQFMGHGKLWNYHLQYLNYLNDATTSISERNKVLIQLSESVNASALKLEAYPVSLRIINTLLFYENVTTDQKSINRALFRQIHFLENNLEYHILANHLLENYIALCMAAIYMNDDRLWNKCYAKLCSELEEQILADGAHYERSHMYHSIVLYRLILLYQVLIKSNKGDYDRIRYYIQKMASWLVTFSLPNDRYPLFQDSCISGAPPVSWISNTLIQLNIEIHQGILSDSAYFKFEHDPIVLYVNAGNVVPTYQPGHAHADMLHFDLYFKGQPIFVDYGISTYESGSQRQYERSTQAHNTVVINGQNQSEIWSQFRMAQRAHIKVSRVDQHHLEGEITHYAGQQWSHKRIFDVHPNQLIIEDFVVAEEVVSSVMYLHCHHNVGNVDLDFEKSKINIAGMQLLILGAHKIVIEDMDEALDFNVYIKSKRISISFEKQIKTIITWHD